jgi:His/Glu/Gln/Arg/opine family amino acid ABC transporter permease subunit
MLSELHLEDIIRYAPLLAKGLGITLLLSLAVMLTALVAGMGVAIARFYRIPVLAACCHGSVYLMRSIPLIMLIVLVHFGFMPLLGIQTSFFLSAYIALSLSTTAYVAEIFRGGFEAIHQQEFEASVSLGLSLHQRLIYVLIPLVIYRMLPALVNQGVTLIKDTSLTSVIGVIELTRSAEIIYERTLHELTLLTFIAIIYFSICYSLSCWSRVLESKLGGQTPEAKRPFLSLEMFSAR